MTAVLVVDDRPEDRELLSTVLGYAGYDILEASSGEEALALIRSADPSLMITDLLMPSMNGYELVRRVRSDPETSKTPVIFSTATYLESEVRDLAKACGVTRFIPKPSDPQEIIRIVGEVVGADHEPRPRMVAHEFDREQLRLLNDKLVEKVGELERVSAERQRLVVQLLSAQEEERQRIADDLHDDSIQAVTSVGMRLDMLGRELTDPHQAEAVERLRETMSVCVERLRRFIFELQAPPSNDKALAAALQTYLEQVEKESGVAFQLHASNWRDPHEAARLLLYRLVQEAVHNVRKHASASRVTVHLEGHEDIFMVRVEDDGVGFDPVEGLRVRPGHLGLPSMRDRLQIVGGSMRIDSAPGKGSAVEISLPDLDPNAT